MPHVRAAGIDIHYIAEERSAEFNLVLIHGSGGSHQSWPAQVLAIPNANVFALDLPGHGRSGGQGQTTLAPYIKAVKDTVDALGLSRVALCGHSLGGAIALQLALAKPPWLDRLVLAGTGAKLRVSPVILQALRSDGERALDLVDSFVFGPQASDSVKEKAREASHAGTAELMHGDLVACDPFDVMLRLGEIDVPTLVIGGTHDLLTPLKYATYLRDHIPNAQLVVLDHAGHAMALEQPDNFSKAIAGFLR